MLMGKKQQVPLASAPSEKVTDHFNDWPNASGFDTRDEQVEPIELSLTGTIPSYAVGTLYRTGPGTSNLETENGKGFAVSHWFDGFTQVHRFQILPAREPSSSTRVLYNSRRTVDALIEHVRKTGKLHGFSFGQKCDPCQSFFKKLMSVFVPMSEEVADLDQPGSRNIGVTISANAPGLEPPSQTTTAEQTERSGIRTLVNKTDASAYQFLDPETLEPVGFANQTVLSPILTGPFSAAHAKTCPITSEVFNYNLDVGATSTYRIFSVSPSTGHTTILATITDAPPAYLHSLFLTANYVILCVWGSHYAYRGMSLMYHRNILDSISPLDPKQPCRWYVVNRFGAEHGVIATYTSPTFYSFHTINAYEEPSATVPGQTDIIADLTCYDDVSVLKRFYYTNLTSSASGASAYLGRKGDSTRPWFGRYRLADVSSQAEGSSGKVSEPKEAVQVFAAPRDISPELPTINPLYVTKPHRYVYGVTDRGSSTFFDGLAKFDTQSQTSIFWQEKAQTAGEAIFVRNPEGTGEDDGVLLSVVLDGYKGKSHLLCLDARNMKEIGRAETNSVVGFGFHGVHVPSHGVEKGKALDL
ncbi:hypothetical protein MMC30_002115 [Trapelia coarctata]|nr:hypothetical protein [Trapelia coarctata]